ncbi:serine/threonine-protein kinase [Neorhodopirellula pilleata]|uniref:Serine/threonine-protein kinase PrkC n=1 Tax=Neorhodopirellula pilleata TaxID=2714738 RepID=A0A5C5ZLR9_9BACT|nr:serine/threonine-protein kinase [Neorhodopirellula pilleata]TWT88026.1 Serine/threonine-protein kinase PrkC [Neorhodopirellula pilleata]
MTQPRPLDDVLDADTVAPDSSVSSATNETTSLPIARRIDDYEIVDELARGGMGVVYRAKQISLGRVVALKMMLGEQHPDTVRRFLTEAESAASLDHPGIVPVFDVGQHDGHLYFTMALIEGESLAERLRRGPMEPDPAARLARDVAVAIGYAHRQRLIHRDVKPANILIDRHGQPRITDFGVCKSLTAQSELTAVGQLIGTPHYMPPEQAGGSSSSSEVANQPVGPTADIYSIGAVLYAMLTGSPPFQAANPIDVVAQVLTREPVPPRTLIPGIPRELEIITLKCLSKRKGDRYQSGEALADDLQRFLSGQPITARPPSLGRRIQHAIHQHLLVATVSGTAALVLVFLTLVLLMSWIKASWQLNELRDQLAQERSTAGSYLAAAKSSREDRDGTNLISSDAHDILAAYELNRLSDSVKRLREAGRHETALQLAIAAATHAQANDLPPTPPIMDVLTENAGDSETNFDLDGLIAQAKTASRQPLSEFEIALYGLAPSPDPTDPSTDGAPAVVHANANPQTP